MHTFHVELYVEYFLGVRLQNSDVFDTFFVTFIRQLHHCCDVVLMVAQEVCGMWHLPLINPSATGQAGGIVNVSDTQNCTHLV